MTITENAPAESGRSTDGRVVGIAGPVIDPTGTPTPAP